MRYLYGDSTPFPLNENFLDTLCAATNVSVALLTADGARSEALRATEEADESVAKELARLEALASSIDRAARMHGAADAPCSVTDAAAARIGQQACATLEEARAGVMRWRDSTVSAAQGAVPDSLGVLASFLVRHQLPETGWSFEWRAGMRGAPTRAQVHAAAPCGITASFDVALPPNHLWAQALRASVLQKRTVIPMMRKAFLRSVAMRDEALHRYYVTEVVHTRERTSILLSRSAQRPHPGLELVVPAAEAGAPITATRLDERGQRASEPAVVAGQAAVAVLALWERMAATMADLVCYRRHLQAAALHGTAVRELPSPATVAQTIVDAVAPIVREMRRRSRTPGELSIKRDLGDGRREEHFVAHQAIERMYAHLPEQQRALFDAFGLQERPLLAVVHSARPMSAPPPSAPSSGLRPVVHHVGGAARAPLIALQPPEEQQTLRLRVEDVLELSELDVISA